jgi:hypothetical protein
MSLVSIVKLVLAVTTLEFYNWEFLKLETPQSAEFSFSFGVATVLFFAQGEDFLNRT